MNSRRLETAFRLAVRDWERGVLSAEQAMVVMASIMEEWDLLKRLESKGKPFEYPLAEEDRVKPVDSDPPPKYWGKE